MATTNITTQKRKRRGESTQMPRKKQSLTTSVAPPPPVAGSFSSPVLATVQKLPNDVLWYIARSFIWDPVGVYNLARTSRKLWHVLDREIYITDVSAVRYLCTGGLQLPKTTLLHWAARAGKLAIARKALDAARLIWQPYGDFQHPSRGHAAVHFAAHYGRLDIVRLLEADGAVDTTAASGWMCPTPQRLSRVLDHLAPGQFRVPPDFLLHRPQYPFKINALGLAILKGHKYVASHLMSCHNEKRDEDQRVFPSLHLAAFVGMYEIVGIMMNKGTDANSRCKHVRDSTPMQWAVAGTAGQKRRRTIDVLIKAGADPTTRDAAGLTALDWAIGFKVPETVQWLLEHPVGTTAPEYSASQVVEWTRRLQRCMADDRLLDCSKLIVRRYPLMPEECLKLCAHSTFWDIDQGWDVPRSASTASKNMETKKWLVEEGLGLGVLSKGARQPWMQEELFLGRSFLHYAAGSIDIEAEMLEDVVKKRPQDINLFDVKGLTPLELALGYRCLPEKVEVLLRHGADPALCYGGERVREHIDHQIRELSLDDD